MTIACAATIEDPFRCPGKWELWEMAMALLPRGRAWQTHEDAAVVARSEASAEVGEFQAGRTGLGTEPWVEELTRLQQYWAAHAEVLEHLHLTACRLIPEFFCESADQLLPEWGIDYGFPDPCSPWDTLCDKVRAQGGATCAYLASLAARIGYEIDCIDSCGAGADCLVADCDSAAGGSVNVVTIRVYRATSRSPLPPPPPQAIPFAADALVADCTPPCAPPDAPLVPPEALVCLIERFKPAHVRAIYQIV